MENNIAGIAGTIAEIRKENRFYGHEIGTAYIAKMLIERNSGIVDELIAVIPEETESKQYEHVHIADAQPGHKLLITGAVQKLKDKETGRTEVFIYADFAAVVEHPLIQNDVNITGEVMNVPEMRETPRGKRITDILVRVQNTITGGGAYVPCICWEEDAVKMAECGKGTVAEIKGRLQSREYTKKHYKGDQLEWEEKRTCREVSVRKLSIMWQPEKKEATENASGAN